MSITKRWSGMSRIYLCVDLLHDMRFRWKQPDMHGKRTVRNQKIVDLEAEIACNDVLLQVPLQETIPCRSHQICRFYNNRLSSSASSVLVWRTLRSQTGPNILGKLHLSGAHLNQNMTHPRDHRPRETQLTTFLTLRKSIL